MRGTLWLVVALLGGGTARLAAQGDCFPGAESNEAKVFAMKSVGLVHSPLRAPGSPEWGTLRLALETAYVPAVDHATATPTICRPGKGPENANPLAVLIRPRLAIELPAGFVVEASWVPPIRIATVRSNLFGIALATVRPLGSGAALQVRAHAELGRIRAPITCPDEALADPNSECYQGTESDDRYDPNIYGLDLTIGFGAPAAGLRPYAGIGYNRLSPRFQVNFTNQQGFLDDRRVSVDLNRAVVFGGATWSVGGRLALTGEFYAAPSDAATGRVLLETWFGR